MHCATTNIGTELGRIPANVFDKERPTLTAGLAKLVDDVHQYAAVIHAGTKYGIAAVLFVRIQP